jgi:branched-subunit amino acid transport protein AzlD
MSLTNQIITIAIVSVGTMITRFLPFILFPENRPVPLYIKKLGLFLPGAIMAVLVVYCYKDLSFQQVGDYLPALVAGGVTVGIHLWRKNMFLSIVLGTACYMVIVNVLI